MPADLASRDCITGWRRDGHPAWLLRQADGTITSVPVRARHELSDGEAMVAATLAGGGLCQLPTWLLAEHLASGGLRTVLDDHAGAEMPIHAVWPRSRYVRPAIRVIVAMLRQHAQMRPSPFYA
ncbi:LysR substrate-binding domain-containing protein [Methylobacterium sp. Leaf100]|nr:LysR substrate-binding domain-containing protein [Methylobacterium sp. Leaf100]KQP25784.1 hypothetical protein ASF25_21280 [Methylobacterium sp. Leaf100]